MNHCRRCDSDYEKPGTCNCFAKQETVNPFEPFTFVGMTYDPCAACVVGHCRYTACPRLTTQHMGTSGHQQ